MKTFVRTVSVRKNFWPDLDQDSIEIETELINRLDREEEYMNRMEPDGPIRFGIFDYVARQEKGLYGVLISSRLWKKFRKGIIRNVGECESCGYRDSLKLLQLHHVSYAGGFYRFFDPENVLVLCRDCHSWMHGI